ncbi:MAG: bifunctional phosphopantothenoylcysteine decarboxylase/phosphopantothenate--cysteine ligase CoaBC [Epsilonproteobacteria bacterium]|nr:MAG: bifunctional phosphopantothenoylcysteine decarboxylase/phosphopantothenate--cysteine ligase CoaBC [Campylobacterota bacterium]
MLLKNKNIALFVTGSIAIYKSIELIRLYIKAGANVKVIMSASAKRFIGPLTFETISKNIVLCDESENWSEINANNHISMAKWANIAIIAPATANTINSLANGMANNILLQTLLAYDGEKIICPSANTKMLDNHITKANLKMLQVCGYDIINPVVKELACGDVGAGAMADIEAIYHKTVRVILSNDYFKHRKVVVSGGATIERIDDMRYISNFSSGKMANSMATALYYMGADVCLVHGKLSQKLHINDIHQIEVENTRQMNEYVVDCIKVAKKGVVTKPTLVSEGRNIKKTPYFFSISAVSDFSPKYPQQGKIKKQNIDKIWNIELEKNIDILKNLNKDGIHTIGFKAEFDKNSAVSQAKNMLQNKNLSAVCLNILDKNNLNQETNTIEIFTTSGKTIKLPTNDKLNLSLDILSFLQASISE